MPFALACCADLPAVLVCRTSVSAAAVYYEATTSCATFSCSAAPSAAVVAPATWVVVAAAGAMTAAAGAALAEAGAVVVGSSFFFASLALFGSLVLSDVT